MIQDTLLEYLRIHLYLPKHPQPTIPISTPRHATPRHSEPQTPTQLPIPRPKKNTPVPHLHAIARNDIKAGR